MSIKYRDNNIYSIYAGNKPVHKIILNNKVIWLEDKGKLSDWRYSTINDKKVLFEYIGADRRNIIVPMDGGETVINNYNYQDKDTPFYMNVNVVHVDLQNVPYVNNDMREAFRHCGNLVSIKGINPNTTDISGAFHYCFNLTQGVQIPSSTVNMIQTFASCHKFDSSIQIPNSVRFMSSAFSDCVNFNRDIQIPDSVIDINETFNSCTRFSSNVIIHSNQIERAYRCFWQTRLPKNVYIPFTYSNGVGTKTFNSFVEAGYLTREGVSTGQNGVRVIDLNSL